MTLQRKTKTTLNVKGQSNAVNVEVRKKRTFVKRTEDEIQAEKAAEQAIKEADEAKIQAELDAKKAQAEKVLAEKLAAKKEAEEKAKLAAVANKQKQAATKSVKTVFTLFKVWSKLETVLEISTSFNPVDSVAKSPLILLKLVKTSFKWLSFFVTTELKE